MTTTQYSYPQQLLSARLVSTSNIAGTYYNGPLNNGVGATLTVSSLTTIDSVTLNVNDRVLLVAQSSANQNGIYIVNSVGSNAVLTRSADFQNIEQIKTGQYLSVSAGTADAGAMYVVIEPLPSAFGINNLSFNPTSDPSSGSFLLASNNLSDVANKPAALSNLGMRVKQASYAGGSATVTITDAAVTSSNIVFVMLDQSTNAVAIQKAAPGTGTIVVTLSGDPGAATVFNYLVFTTTTP